MASTQSVPRRRGDRLLGIAEDLIYFGIAALLVGAAVVVLLAQLRRFLDVFGSSANIAMLELLDGLLLVFIFVELLFAVRTTIKEREIVAEPFLIVGIIASIKEIVVLSVEAAEAKDDAEIFTRSMTEVGVLGGLVLLLSVSALLLRLKERSPEEGSRDENVSPPDPQD